MLMREKDPALYARALEACQRLDTTEKLTVRLSKNTTVTGVPVKAEPHRFRETRTMREVIFKVTLLCGILKDVPKIEKTVYIKRIPTHN